MYDIKVNLPYLEGLTTGELWLLADNFDIGLQPGLDRSLLIAELLEAAPCLGLYHEQFTGRREDVLHLEPPEPPLISKTLLELPPPVSLPKQYGFTYIDVIIRDPFWIFVLWEISTADKRKYEKKAGFNGFLLRVRLHDCSIPEGQNTILSAAIDGRDTSRYLNFPPEAECRKFCGENTACPYIVELCVVRNEREIVLVASHPFKMPRSLPLPGAKGSEIFEDPMYILSGIAHLNVYRNVE
jgi:hypothetical protein